MPSPYEGAPPEKWIAITNELIDRHPLSIAEIVEIVLQSWNSIFDSRMGTQGFRIGREIFPKPQIMGFFLHELIPLEVAARYPEIWRPEKMAADKDIVYVPDDFYSMELKTSSNAKQIFGNRSYAQEGDKKKKAKCGYYLTVNFEKFTTAEARPKIRLVRFGWVDSSDWIGQKAATGQQSRLPSEVYKYKLPVVYER